MPDKTFTPIQKLIVCLSVVCLTLLSQLSAQEQLKHENLFKISLDELLNMEVVSASKAVQKINKVPATVRVITADQIRKRGYFTLEEALSDLPGFQFRNISGFNSYTFLRGVPNQNNLLLVLVDGVRINELNSGGFYGGGQYNLSNVERIEVVYGPASVLYGTNAMSGIINIITRNPEKINSGHISATVGSYATNVIDIGYENVNQENSLGYRISGMLKKSDKSDLRGTKGDNNWTDNMENFEDDLSFDGKLTYNNLIIGAIYQDKNASRSTIRNAVDSRYLDSGTNWHIRFLNSYAKYLYDKSNNWSIQSMAYYRNATVADNTVDYIIKKNDSDPGDQVRVYRPNNLIGFESQLNFKMWEKLPFIAGMTLERESLAREYSLSHSLSQDIKAPKPVKPEMTANRLVGFYLQSQYNVVDNISLTAGVSQDFSSYYGDVFTPRTGLVFNKGRLTAKLLYNEAFRAPKPWDYTYGSGNPDLKSERMRSGELCLSYMFSNIINIDGSLYRNEIKGILTNDLDNDYWINRNKALTNGVELTLQHSHGKIRAYTNYTYSNSEDQDGNPIPEIAKHTANAGVEYSFTPKFQVNIRENYIGNKRNPKIIPSTGNNLVGDAIVFNTSLSYLDFYDFDFHIDVKNLFDAKYYHTSNLDLARYRQPQQMILIGIAYNY